MTINKISLYATLLMMMPLNAQVEKIKGSRTVTTEDKEIGDFTAIEISNNLEVFLIKGDKCSLEIEADDNLHEAIGISLHGNLLQLSASAEVSGAKKFSVRVTYASDLKSVWATDNSNITALADVMLEDFTMKATGSARVYANIRTTNFKFSGDDKSKSELNIVSEKASVDLSKNAQLKATVSAPEFKCDMYQKSVAAIDGDAIDLKLRLDNNATLNGKSLISKNAALTMEGYTTCSITVTGKATIEASGKAEIDLFGDQKIEMKSFMDNAILRKKPTK